MKLLFDLTATQSRGKTKYHGGAEYSKIVFKALLSRKTDENIATFYNPNHPLSSDIQKHIEQLNIPSFPAASSKDISRIIRNEKPDIFFSGLPYKYSSLEKPQNTRFIFTIHGLREIETIWHEPRRSKIYANKPVPIKKILKNQLKSTNWTYNIYNNKKYNHLIKKYGELLTAADTPLITDSNFSKYSLLLYFPQVLTGKEINVYYPPNNNYKLISSEDEENKILRNQGIEKNSYYLLTGGDRWVKNSHKALKSLDLLFQKHPAAFKNKQVLVLGGNKSNLLSGIKLKSKFLIKDYASRNNLNILYKNAFLFIYPTINEGFGYQPQESMRYGTPVACSAVSSLPEIYKDAVIYFNPFSINDIANNILEISLDDKKRSRLVSKSKEHNKKIENRQKKDLEKLIELLLGFQL